MAHCTVSLTTVKTAVCCLLQGPCVPAWWAWRCPGIVCLETPSTRRPGWSPTERVSLSVLPDWLRGRGRFFRSDLDSFPRSQCFIHTCMRVMWTNISDKCLVASRSSTLLWTRHVPLSFFSRTQSKFGSAFTRMATWGTDHPIMSVSRRDLAFSGCKSEGQNHPSKPNVLINC